MSDVLSQLPSDSVDADMAKAALLYEALLGRAIDTGAVASLETRFSAGRMSAFECAIQLVSSSEFLSRMVREAVLVHPHFIHAARIRMIRTLLPPAKNILDLGGANAPLFTMGYEHAFEQMVLVDLPPLDRHDQYKDVVLEKAHPDPRVLIHYGDMSDLSRYADGSFDLVWSGQSIEHIDPAAAIRACEGAYRVLTPGGYFCLDTPNRDVTKIHKSDLGGGFVDPDHKHEYYSDELRQMLLSAGFFVEAAAGICEMPQTRRTNRFHYEDFVLGQPVVDNPDDGYIFYFAARKPVR